MKGQAVCGDVLWAWAQSERFRSRTRRLLSTTTTTEEEGIKQQSNQQRKEPIYTDGVYHILRV
jgi:hypothetical protein